MLVVVALTLLWAFLLVLALALLRSAGMAERNAERRLQEARRRRAAPEQRRRKAVTTALMVAALPLAGASVGVDDADAQSCRGARLAPGGLAPTATVCLINAERRARGLAPLVANARLGSAARRHAADMVTRAYFSHVSPSGELVRRPPPPRRLRARLRLGGRRDAGVGLGLAGHAGFACQRVDAQPAASRDPAQRHLSRGWHRRRARLADQRRRGCDVRGRVRPPTLLVPPS